MNPAMNATGILPATRTPSGNANWRALPDGALGRVEAGELAVDEPVELGIELSAAGGRRLAAVRPPPREPADDRDRDDQPDQRQQPGEQVEAVLRRRGEHLLAELRDERVLDLALRLPGRDLVRDEHLHVLGDGGVRLVERRAADRAHDLALELVLGGPAVARKRGRGYGERQRDHAEESPHAGLSAVFSMRVMS